MKSRRPSWFDLRRSITTSMAFLIELAAPLRENLETPNFPLCNGKAKPSSPALLRLSSEPSPIGECEQVVELFLYVHVIAG